MTVTAHVAVAVCRALERCGVQPGIKWTNDLVLGTKKLCGILTELTVEAESGTVDSIVAGIGVNVRQRPEDFPEELRAIAGSVRSETGQEISRARLAAEMVRALDGMYLDWQRDPRVYLSDYRARCVTVGRPVRVVRGEDVRTGFAEAVDDDFARRPLAGRAPRGETVTGGLQVADAAVVAVFLALGGLVFKVFAQVAEGARRLDLLDQLRAQLKRAVVDLVFHLLNVDFRQFVIHEKHLDFSDVHLITSRVRRKGDAAVLRAGLDRKRPPRYNCFK